MTNKQEKTNEELSQNLLSINSEIFRLSSKACILSRSQERKMALLFKEKRKIVAKLMSNRFDDDNF
jgi:hypothetical protein